MTVPLSALLVFCFIANFLLFVLKHLSLKLTGQIQKKGRNENMKQQNNLWYVSITETAWAIGTNLIVVVLST